MDADASWLMVTKVFAVVLTVVTVLVTAGLLFLGAKLARIINRLLGLLDLVTRETGKLAGTVNETTEKISARADRVAAAAEEKITSATSNLEEAAKSVSKAAAGPVGSLGPLVMGLMKGFGAGRERDETAGSEGRDP
jgi:predicted PurR-regulated permease PerM